MNSPTSLIASPKRSWKTSAPANPMEERYAAVRDATEHDRVWRSPKDLVNFLSLAKRDDRPILEKLIKDQYSLARNQRKRAFAAELREEAAFIVTEEFLVRELGKAPAKKRSSKPSVCTTTTSMCKDIRARDDPNIQVVSWDLGKEFPILASREGSSVTVTSAQATTSTSTGTSASGSRSYASVAQAARPSSSRSKSLSTKPSTVSSLTHLDSKPLVQKRPSLDTRSSARSSTATTGTSSVQKNRDRDHRSKARTPARKQRSRSRTPETRSGEAEEPGSPILPNLVITTGEFESPDDRSGDTDDHGSPIWTDLTITTTIPGSSVSSRRRPMPCPISSACANIHNLRRHVMLKHFPPMFRNDRLLMPGHDANRVEAIGWLATTILGEKGNLDQLLSWVEGNLAFPENAFVDDVDLPWLQRICSYQKWSVPSQFTLHPVNSLALLGHWRVLAQLVASLSPSSRANFRARVPLKRPDFHLSHQPSPLVDTAEMDEEFVVIDEVGSEEETDPVASAEHQEITALTASTSHGAVDSHFHLDRATHHIMGKDEPLCIPNLITMTDGLPPQYPVQVTGGVCVFCDPATYPDVFPSFTGFKCAVGFHPRHALRFNQSTLHRILELLKSSAVAEFGEIGLDHTEPESTWQKQAEVFSSLLEYSMPARPLVLHLRGQDDLYSTECSLAALNLARVGLASTQRIHLHCFTGNPALMHNWLQQFPRCYFGFTGLVRSFDSQQIQALTKVPTDRLLIETDSPYLRPSKGRNTPAYLGDVAVLIAKHRKLPVEELLYLTAVNAQQLYHLD